MNALRTLVYLLVFSVASGCCWLCLDEEQILKDTHQAFAAQTYRSEPFEKALIIQSFANFLLLHSDTIVSYSQSNKDSTVLDTDGTYSKYLKRENCFLFVMSKPDFDAKHFPPHLHDSLSWYIEQIGPTFLTRFNLCNNRYGTSINKEQGNVVLYFGYNHNPSDNPHYSWFHFAYKNRKEVNYNRIKTIKGILQKDTLLVDDMRYAIRVLPYSGW